MTVERVRWSWLGLIAATVVAVAFTTVGMFAGEFVATGSATAVESALRDPVEFAWELPRFVVATLLMILVTRLAANFAGQPARAFIWWLPAIPLLLLLGLKLWPLVAELVRPLSTRAPFAGLGGAHHLGDLVGAILTGIGYYLAALTFLEFGRSARRTA